VSSTLPIRVRAAHACYPNPICTYLVFPVVKNVCSRDLRLRFKVHTGSTTKVLQELAGYGLSKDRLPAEVGGDVVLDMSQWVMERMRLENSFTNADGPVAKRPKTHVGNEDESPTHVSAAPAGVDAVTKASAVETKVKRSNASGQSRQSRSDPRMDKAVQLKLADPDLPLHDALVSAGYSFHEDANGRVDDDGISLRQRTNNLCRRIRREREKLKASEQPRPENPSPSTGTCTTSTSVSSSKVLVAMSGALKRLDVTGSGMSISPLLPSGVVPRSRADSQQIELTTDDDAAYPERLDSFDEAIDLLELPGIEEIKGLDFIGDVDL